MCSKDFFFHYGISKGGAGTLHILFCEVISFSFVNMPRRYLHLNASYLLLRHLDAMKLSSFKTS